MRLRLAPKIVCIFLIAEAMSLLTLSFVFIHYGQNLITSEIEERGDAVAHFLAQLSTYPVLAWNPDLIMDSAKVVMLQKDVVGLEILGNKGQPLVELGKRESPHGVMVFSADILGESQKFTDEEAVIGNLSQVTEKLGVVRIYMGLEDLKKDIRSLKLTVFSIAALTFLITVLIGAYSVHYFVARPLRKLMEGVKRVSSGDLDTITEINTADELEKLSEAFNKMLVALKANLKKRIEETEYEAMEQNLVILGELSSMLIHEVGNMLNRFSVIEYQLSEEKLSKRGRELIDNFRKELKSLQKFTENVRLFSKRPELELKAIDLVNFLKVIVASFKFMNPKGLKFVFETGVKECLAYVDEDALRQVMVNLITNASDVSDEGSEVRVALGVHGERVRIEVRDNGPGISEEDREKVFTPFFTTKGPLGTGLGLAIVRSLIEAHGGRVWFESHPGNGTTFFVELPVLKAS